MTITAASVRNLTQGTGTYTTGAMSTATKKDQSIHETPQSSNHPARKRGDSAMGGPLPLRPVFSPPTRTLLQKSQARFITHRPSFPKQSSRF